LAIGKEQWFCLATHKHTPCSPDPLPSLQPSFECSLIIFSLSSIHPVLKVRLGPASLGRRDNISLEYLKKTQHPIDSWTGQLLGSECVLYSALVGSARTAATSAVCVCRWARKHSSFARWNSSFLSQGWRLLVSFVHLQTTAEKRKKKKSLFLQGQENWSYCSLLALISVKAGTVKALFLPGSSRQFCLGEIEASAAALW